MRSAIMHIPSPNAVCFHSFNVTTIVRFRENALMVARRWGWGGEGSKCLLDVDLFQENGKVQSSMMQNGLEMPVCAYRELGWELRGEGPQSCAIQSECTETHSLTHWLVSLWHQSCSSSTQLWRLIPAHPTFCTWSFKGFMPGAVAQAYIALASQEAEAGGLLKPKNSRLAWEHSESW